jgi:hypothetical protein
VVPDPRGAAGAILEPSGATRGEPFATNDGWTVRIETLALHGTLTAAPRTFADGGSAGSGSFEGGAFLWNGALRAELVVPAISTGFIDLSLVLHGKRGVGKPVSISSFENVNVDQATAERLVEPPEIVDRRVGPPSFVVAGRAEKAARLIRFDWTVTGTANEVTAPLEIRADDVSFIHVEVAAESLFAGNDATGFDAFALADEQGDRDGRVTVVELRATRVGQVSLYDRFGERAAGLLVLR